MARTYSVTEIAVKVRDRGDWNDSPYITDDFLLDAIDSARAEVHDILVSKFEDAYTTASGLTATGGSATVNLPTNFYKLLGVDLSLGGDQYRTLHRWNWHERTIDSSSSSYRYRLLGSTLHLRPTPGSDESLRVWYIPSATKLSEMTDEVDGVNGFEELMVALVQRKCHVREGTSTAPVDEEIDRQLKRVELMSGARDAGEPESLQDVCFGRMDEDDLL